MGIRSRRGRVVSKEPNCYGMSMAANQMIYIADLSISNKGSISRRYADT